MTGRDTGRGKGEVTGGCQCGQVRFTLSRAAGRLYCCHCRECQKQSASAFGMSLSVRRADVQVTGTMRSWERDTDLGTRTRCFFCPECGSRVMHQGGADQSRATIKAGALDDTSSLSPDAHIWVSRKQPWVILDPDVPTHATQPDDLDAWRGKRDGAQAS